MIPKSGLVEYELYFISSLYGTIIVFRRVCSVLTLCVNNVLKGRTNLSKTVSKKWIKCMKCIKCIKYRFLIEKTIFLELNQKNVLHIMKSIISFRDKKYHDSLYLNFYIDHVL